MGCVSFETFGERTRPRVPWLAPRQPLQLRWYGEAFVTDHLKTSQSEVSCSSQFLFLVQAIEPLFFRVFSVFRGLNRRF